MTLLDSVKQLIKYYSDYLALLNEETKTLVDNKIPEFNEVVSKKIELLTSITEYEKKRISFFGEVTLDELISNENDEHLKSLGNELKDIISKVNELTETNKILMDQLYEYSKVMIDALVSTSKESVTYSKEKKYSTNENSINLINKSI